jgi:hypothetical protein
MNKIEWYKYYYRDIWMYGLIKNGRIITFTYNNEKWVCFVKVWGVVFNKDRDKYRNRFCNITHKIIKHKNEERVIFYKWHFLKFY